MAWLDSYRQASFRGLEFKVEAHDARFGRRQVTHEFAQRDTPFTEDLGRRAQSYSIDAYLIGDDYPAQRDQLRAACETAGPGELVHPYLGSMQVVCTGLTIRESVSDARMCFLQITFTEAGEAKFPTDLADPVRAVSDAADSAKQSLSAGFLSRFSVDGFASFVVDAAAGRVSGLSDFMQSLPVNPVAEAQTVAAFFGRVKSLGANALALVTKPAQLISEITAIIGSVRSVFGSRANDALGAIRTAYVPDYDGVLSTPNREQQAENQDSISAAVRRLSICEMAVFAVLQAEASGDQVGSSQLDPPPFETREDAITVRDSLIDAIDYELESPITSTEEFQSMTDLRAQLVRNVPSPDQQLPRIATYTPAATLPSLVVAYQVYADAGRSVEIAERNRVRHPGFMQGRDPIEVLTNG